jgi:hypothetical protein
VVNPVCVNKRSFQICWKSSSVRSGLTLTTAFIEEKLKTNLLINLVFQSPPNKFLNLSFGKLNEVTLPLHPVLTISLIQKGGGTWPCDALATNLV